MNVCMYVYIYKDISQFILSFHIDRIGIISILMDIWVYYFTLINNTMVNTCIVHIYNDFQGWYSQVCLALRHLVTQQFCWGCDVSLSPTYYIERRMTTTAPGGFEYARDEESVQIAKLTFKH